MNSNKMNTHIDSLKYHGIYQDFLEYTVEQRLFATVGFAHIHIYHEQYELALQRAYYEFINDTYRTLKPKLKQMNQELAMSDKTFGDALQFKKYLKKQKSFTHSPTFGILANLKVASPMRIDQSKEVLKHYEEYKKQFAIS